MAYTRTIYVRIDYDNTGKIRLSGIDLSEKPIPGNRIQAFANLITGVRDAGLEDFFDPAIFPDIDKLGPLIEAIDFVEGTGLPLSSIQNFDLDNPTAFTLKRSDVTSWLNDMSNLPADTLSADSIKNIKKMQAYLKHANTAPIEGFRTMAWFLADVMAGSTSDFTDLGKNIMRFAKTFRGGTKLIGMSAKEISEEAVTKMFKSVESFGKLGKLAGSFATAAMLAYDLYAGITAFKEVKAAGATTAELAYHFFTTMGGRPRRRNFCSIGC